LRKLVIIFLLLIFVPIGVSAARYFWMGDGRGNWQTADRGLDAVPELKAVLPPTAIGKDYPYEGDWFGLTASRTGAYASLVGYLGLTIGRVEGFEINCFGAVPGFDLRRPALKLHGGRLGMTAGL
jgi:hypothetical protein